MRVLSNHDKRALDDKMIEKVFFFFFFYNEYDAIVDNYAKKVCGDFYFEDDKGIEFSGGDIW